MKDKKIETMLDELNEELQRHIISSALTKNFVAAIESGVAYVALDVVAKGGVLEVETLFLQSETNGIESRIFLDGEETGSSESPISITKLTVPKGKHRIEVAASGNIVAGKVSLSGLFTDAIQTN